MFGPPASALFDDVVEMLERGEKIDQMFNAETKKREAHYHASLLYYGSVIF